MFYLDYSYHIIGIFPSSFFRLESLEEQVQENLVF